MTINLQYLEELGLSQGQIEVFTAVLELGSSTLNKIQEKTGIERRNIYDILNKLIEKGFISYTVEKGKKTYQCTHPSKILEEVKKKEERLKELENKIPEIKSLFDLSKPDIRAEVYRGNESIKSLFDEIITTKESFWMGGNSFENYKSVPENLQIWFKHWMQRRKENNHVMHDLVSHGTYLEELPPKDTKKHKKELYHYSELPEGFYTPMVIIIFGSKVAQILWSKQSFAFVIDSKEIKNSFMKYFNYFWKIAKK